MEKNKITVFIGSLQAAVASLLALLQLLTLIINISQEQWKLHYLIANIVTFPKMAL